RPAFGPNQKQILLSQDGIRMTCHPGPVSEFGIRFWLTHEAAEYNEPFLCADGLLSGELLSSGDSLLSDTMRDNQAHNMKKSKTLVRGRRPQAGTARLLAATKTRLSASSVPLKL